MVIQIEWKSSHYHSNGRRRSRPKPSTIHGWLVKWRATFSGDERLRKEGIREMREAKAVRERKRQQKAARRAKAGGSNSPSFFRLWPVSRGKKPQLETPKRLPCSAQHTSKRPGRKSTRRLTYPNHSPRPILTNNRQTSCNRKATGDRNPPSSRMASHDCRKDTVRKKRRSTAPT